MAEFEFNLRDLFRVVRRRKWVIIVSPLLVGALTYFLSESPPTFYQAEALVKISRVAANMQALLIEALSWYQGDNLETQSRIITSQRIKVRVARQLSRRHPEFRAVSPQASEERLLKDPNLLKVINRINVQAERKGDSDIIGIKATASSSQLAVDVANATAREFRDFNIEERNRQIREAVQFIQERIAGTEADVARAEREVEEFRRENAGALTETSRHGELQVQLNRVERKIESMQNALRQVEQMRSADGALTLSPVFADADDSSLSQLEKQALELTTRLRDLKSQRQQLLRTRTDQSREVQQNAQLISDVEKRTIETIESLNQRYHALRRELFAERQQLIDRIRLVSSTPQVSRQLDSLQRELDLKTEALNALQKRLQDAEIQQASEIQEIALVEEATDASALSGDTRRYKALIGLLIGLILGVVFAFVLESLDTSIGTIEDVEHYLKLPVLGVVPHLDLQEIKKNIDQVSTKIPPDELDHLAVLCTHFDPKAPVSEAYRSTRAHVEAVLKKNKWKTILVTSSVLQEGKTNTACNLAVVFAQSGQKTMLIDADLRRPRVHRIFGVPRTPGLTDLLLGVSDWETGVKSVNDLVLGKMGMKNVQLNPGLDYLSVLTSGSKVNNPAETLNLEKFTDLLAELRERYEVVIIDVAPLLPVADASILAPLVDATLIAYQIGRIGRDVVKRSKNRLESLGATVSGVVMNDIKAEIDYTPDYHHYYSYQYEQAGFEVTSQPSGLLARFRERLSRRSDEPSGRSRSEQKLVSERQADTERPGGKSQDYDPQLDDLMRLTDDE